MTAPVSFVPDFITPQVQMEWFEQLKHDLAWERREGAPRSEYWVNTYGRPYTYGRGAGIRTYQAKLSHEIIESCRALIGHDLEGCFLNHYLTSQDSLGWHADDDPGIDHTRPIAVVTLGHRRDIQFKSQVPGSHPQTLTLTPGSLLLMHAGMQQTHYHRIPKVIERTDFYGPRISLTYRGLLP